MLKEIIESKKNLVLETLDKYINDNVAKYAADDAEEHDVCGQGYIRGDYIEGDITVDGETIDVYITYDADYDSRIIDESFTHAFGIERLFSHETEVTYIKPRYIYLSYNNDEEGCEIDPDTNEIKYIA